MCVGVCNDRNIWTFYVETSIDGIWFYVKKLIVQYEYNLHQYTYGVNYFHHCTLRDSKQLLKYVHSSIIDYEFSPCADYVNYHHSKRGEGISREFDELHCNIIVIHPVAKVESRVCSFVVMHHRYDLIVIFYSAHFRIYFIYLFIRIYFKTLI
jgi:hypothetical protein